MYRFQAKEINRWKLEEEPKLEKARLAEEMALKFETSGIREGEK